MKKLLVILFALGLSGCIARLPFPTDTMPIDGSRYNGYRYVWNDFCARNGDFPQCTEHKLGGRHLLELTLEDWKALNAIHNSVLYDYTPDEGDHWDLITRPNGDGDCEDLALTKIKRAIEAGFDRRAFSMGVYKSEYGGYHAVPLVHTTQGTYVMDDRYKWLIGYSDIEFSWHTAYDDNTGKWVRLDDH